MDGKDSSKISSPRVSRFVPLKLEEMASSRRGSFSSSKPNDIIQHSLPSSQVTNVEQTSVLTQNTHSSTSTPIQQQQDPRRLLAVVENLVRNRSGSVLTRQTILKADHFRQATNTKLEFFLSGAPNFRAAELNVYGVAQPTVIGLSSILALLNCHPKSLHQQTCTWFLTREEPIVYLNGYPYCLREYADPMQNMGSFSGINASRLEMVEERLRADVVKEANAMGGLLLVHQEMDDGTVVPCFIAADRVETPKEVFLYFKNDGYRLNYFRIPISPMQAPEDNYFDEYVRVIKTLEPSDPLIFNCGMGGVRTTVGTILAQIIRRTQLLERGLADPYPVPGYFYTSDQVSPSLGPEFIKGLHEADIRNTQNGVLLRLIYVLEKGLGSKANSKSVIEWAFGKGQAIETLKEAIMGNYYSVASLVSVLEHGSYCKRLLDEVIDQSDAVVNIRDDILLNRIKQTTQGSSDYRKEASFLSKALMGLQRYMALLCFTSYINDSPNTQFDTRFSSWFKARTEVWRMVQNMRVKGPQLYFFRPVDDLSSMGNIETQKLGSLGHHRPAGMFEMIGAGAQSGSMALEAEEFILKSRTGVVLTSQTILKIDFWRQDLLNKTTRSTPTTIYQEDSLLESSDKEKHDDVVGQMHHTFYIEGASNFRRIDNTHIYGVAQPTVDGLRSVLRRLFNNRTHHNDSILWINLREEPIIYINGIPYVLRDRYFTLRNIRAYKGITGARLEQLEERLKEDVIKEIHHSNGRILLHGEDQDGNVITAWEDVNEDDVMTVREVMETVASDMNIQTNKQHKMKDDYLLDYHRLPVTAEKAPDWVDFDEMRLLIANHCQTNSSAIVLNCQVGIGRSTMGTVMATLINRWMYNANDMITPTIQPRLNYQIINSLLRVIKNGLENKSVVDNVIDQCGAVLNLRDMIESVHIRAEETTDDDDQRRRILKTGMVALERYFLLICFQAYLDNTSPDTLNDTESFLAWSKRHAEIGTILQELRRDEIMEHIAPVEKSSSIGDGVALSSEVMSVVRKRCGQVLSQNSILKHDAFPGCQKMNLTEKIEGAYNYRRVQVKTVKRAVRQEHNVIEAIEGGLAADLKRSEDEILVPPFICGCAMPSKDAIKAVLVAMDAGPGGKRKVLWTCLREEPVLYVNNQPYVLRLFANPLKNLETTGIARSRVEGMENRMKLDALDEQKEYGGRLLLHDEEVDERGGFNLEAIWETVPSQCIETPSEVFQSIIDEGYQVDYLRIPITDEQAPIPDVFDLLKHRILEANVGKDVLFNCQMGRGRTTTGMVAACLISMILNNNNCMVDGDHLLNDTSKPEGLQDDRLFDTDRDEQSEEREGYLNGEYKIILQVVSVLTYGKLAKRLTDEAINMCDHMQNLRRAIYDYRLRLDSLMDNSKKYTMTREVGLNYLVRYFYLIVFADYLLEEMLSPSCAWHLHHSTRQQEQEIVTEDQAQHLTTFKSWLAGRREITNIIRFQSFDLS
ncbi:inositol hexakisphosphate-domain-containing protein [Halteromyces radiatus]|uniref:inositol hexakisphosphate-domain-containing protein n=1 Tax=Halteromyces radiatus TaxID=101107 RepID=UPI00221FB342|nr:inositol hexakisphosphate-domain-containing protein [Halteromyces radiatus]KAI8078822.1 inositol hexakisphosphate-domain-containing protein [Halteromyces radiatus]